MWDPFEERTKRWDRFMSVLEDNMTAIVTGTVACMLLLCLTCIAVVNETTNTIPCKTVQERLDKLEMPTYYKLTPINPSSVHEKGEFNVN